MTGARPSEFDLIRRYFAPLAAGNEAALDLGDDAALLTPPPGRQLVLTTDTIVAGIHYPEGEAAEDIAKRLLRVNLSDLAAMGAEPVAAIVGMGLPPGFSASGGADALAAGVEEMAGVHGVTVAGGDLTASPVLVIGVTAIGRPVAGVTPLRRCGGQIGDILCVTGSLGASAAGLALLEDPFLLPHLPQRSELTRAHLRPTPRLRAGRTLARGGARAMMDLSDGVALDARRLAVAGGVRARVDLFALPLAPGVAAVAEALGREPQPMAASGGEDYELLVAIAPGRVGALTESLDVPLTAVGELVEGAPGIDLRDAAGRRVEIDRLGWEHDV